MKTLLMASSALLGLALPSLAQAQAARLEPVVVTAPSSISNLADLPTTRESMTAETIARTVNVLTPEDTLRYMPNIAIRQRHIGDTQSPMTTRTSGLGASARSLIYVDGVLISSLIGNNNTSASPKWGLVSPDAIERLDVLYGPFAAAYAGNSIGAVVAFTTRMPKAFEGSFLLQGATQSFSKYGDDDSYGTWRVAANIGDRFGRFAFRLSYNHLDTDSHPLTYATVTVPATTSTNGTAVTGGFSDANRTGAPIVVLGSTGLERQVQDNVSGRMTYELTPAVTASYTFGLFKNRDDSMVNSYLRDAAGQAVYSGSVNIAGRAYTLANTAFSNGVYNLRELQLAQGLSVASHSDGVFDLELVATRFDYLKSRQRTPSGALPGAFSGGAGTAAWLDNTNWYTLDANGTWRPQGVNDAHIFTFGAHQDRYSLKSPRYALASWTSGAVGATQALNRGSTRTRALWLQDVWTLTPQLKATLGGRYESWRAYNGLNYSLTPALNVSQPPISHETFSPKGVLAWSPRGDWTFKASMGLAYRFPTVSELYQAVTVGTQLQTPNPNLKPERALSSELSVERRWMKGNVRVSVFDERIHDTLLSQTALLPSGASASFVQNIDRTRATGIELVVSQRDVLIRGFDLSGWATYVDAKTTRNAAFPAAVGKSLPGVPHWRGAIVATYSPNDRLDLTLAGRYSDRQFSAFDNTDRYANTYQGFSGYFVMDAHARYKITSHLAADVGVNNLLGRSYFLFHPFPQRTLVLDLKYRF